MKKALTHVAFLALLSLSQQSRAALQYNGGEYRQNFDSAGGSLVNDVTFSGWYAYGNEGGDLFFDRADLNWNENRGAGVAVAGSLVTIPASDLLFALVLRNNTTNTYACFKLSFANQQWLVNTPLAGSASRIRFSYGLTPTFTAGSRNPNSILPHTSNPDDFLKGFNTLPDLDVTAFLFGNETRQLDGTLAANQQRRSKGVGNAVWAPGDYLILRWFVDYNIERRPQKLGVDDVSFQAARVMFSDVVRLADGKVRLTVCGLSGDSYRVETSPDLSQWSTVGTFSNANGCVEVTDDAAAASSKRFYRARLL